MRAQPEGCSARRRPTRRSPEVFGWLPVIASPELLAGLSVEIDRPYSVNKSVRPEAIDVNGEVVEVVPVGMLAGLVKQADGHPVVGVHAATVLTEVVVEGRGELDVHPGQVVLAARDVPRARSGAVLHDHLARRPLEKGPVVTLADGVEGRLGPDEVGVIVRCRVRLLCHARIVAPGPRRNICQMADAASRWWGILNPFEYSCDRSLQTGQRAGSPVSARGSRRRVPGRAQDVRKSCPQIPIRGRATTAVEGTQKAMSGTVCGHA